MNTRRWTIWLMLCAFVTIPVALADEEKAAKEEEAVKEEVNKADEAAPKDKTEELVKKMAELTLDHNVVPAKTLNIAWSGKTKTLRQVMEKLEEWGEEDEIGAVLLNVTDCSLSISDVQELHQGVARLKEQDKKVFAYCQAGPMGYLLACAADEICVAPAGDVILPGFGITR